MEHTKGPWQAIEVQKCEPSGYAFKVHQVPGKLGNWPIALTVMESDAHLIAQAPALLAALEALAAGGVGASRTPEFWCVYCGKDNSHLDDAPDDADERHEEDCPILEARAVIDAATS